MSDLGPENLLVLSITALMFAFCGLVLWLTTWIQTKLEEEDHDDLPDQG